MFRSVLRLNSNMAISFVHTILSQALADWSSRPFADVELALFLLHAMVETKANLPGTLFATKGVSQLKKALTHFPFPALPIDRGHAEDLGGVLRPGRCGVGGIGFALSFLHGSILRVRHQFITYAVFLPVPYHSCVQAPSQGGGAADVRELRKLRVVHSQRTGANDRHPGCLCYIVRLLT